MGCPGDSYTRTVASNHSDYDIYADTGGTTPTMRHSWNPDNTLAEWQERFGEDRHSRLMPVQFDFRGTGFKLLSRDGTNVAGPLPEACGWKPAVPGLVGASITQWPLSAGQVQGGPVTWANENTLARHLADHGADFRSSGDTRLICSSFAEGLGAAEDHPRFSNAMEIFFRP